MVDLLNGVNLDTLILFAVLVLPGFISMRVYSLIRPGEQPTLKDTVFEAFAYSTINLGLMYWAIDLFLSSDNPLFKWILVALIIAIMPVVWPFLLDRVLNFLARTGLISYRSKTAWDDFFSRRQRCWLIVHFDDGTKLGGKFSEKSYATVYPTPGHLYIEELWNIDQETGEFLGDEPISSGIILKPSDYRFVEIKEIVD